MNQTPPTAALFLAAAAALAATLALSRPSPAADDTYQVTHTDPTAAVGTRSKASVTVSARKGWHLNAEAPLTLKMTPAPGVAVDKNKLVRGDLALSSDSTARFDVGVTPSEPGKQAIEAELSFVLCQEEACRPIKEKLTLTVEASPAKATAEKKNKKK
jgi:hypothetical protein